MGLERRLTEGKREAGMGILRLQEKGMPFTGCLEGEGRRSTDSFALSHPGLTLWLGTLTSFSAQGCSVLLFCSGTPRWVCPHPGPQPPFLCGARASCPATEEPRPECAPFTLPPETKFL